MINNFKDTNNNNNNKSSIDNILQNKDDYKLLSKVAYKKHQNNTEDAIKNTNYKYDILRSWIKFTNWKSFL